MQLEKIPRCGNTVKKGAVVTVRKKQGVAQQPGKTGATTLLKNAAILLEKKIYKNSQYRQKKAAKAAKCLEEKGGAIM